MKRKTASFSGTRPIFTGSPAIVMGGFNLDKENQNFSVDDVIPAGTLAIRDEETRKVQMLKTAKVTEVDASDSKRLILHVDEFYAPFFAVGDKVMKDGAISGTFAAAPAITKVEESGNIYAITLDKAISGIKAGDVVVEVVKDASSNAAERGTANSVTFHDIVVNEFETSVDVSADTMQYALYERRVLPIPASQKDATGSFLKANPHIKLTKSR